jgi:hypothetical protein
VSRRRGTSRWYATRHRWWDRSPEVNAPPYYFMFCVFDICGGQADHKVGCMDKLWRHPSIERATRNQNPSAML